MAKPNGLSTAAIPVSPISLSQPMASDASAQPVAPLSAKVGVRSDARIEVTEQVREWDYGDYEGVTSKTIREQRKEKGEAEWDIWRDGCPGGEYVTVIAEALRPAYSGTAN